MRWPLTVLLIIAFTVPCPAQTNTCTLKLEEAPEVRGFKLGQEYEVVLKGLPSVRLPPRLEELPEKSELGVRRLDLMHRFLYAQIEPKASEAWKARFEGVGNAELTFLDDKLAAMEIAYDASTKWNDPLEFTAAIARSLNLPRQGWRGRYPIILDCAGFTVETSLVLGSPRLTIKLRDLDGELVTRKYENERKKRERFKP